MVTYEYYNTTCPWLFWLEVSSIPSRKYLCVEPDLGVSAKVMITCRLKVHTTLVKQEEEGLLCVKRSLLSRDSHGTKVIWASPSERTRHCAACGPEILSLCPGPAPDLSAELSEQSEEEGENGNGETGWPTGALFRA